MVQHRRRHCRYENIIKIFSQHMLRHIYTIYTYIIFLLFSSDRCISSRYTSSWHGFICIFYSHAAAIYEGCKRGHLFLRFSHGRHPSRCFFIIAADIAAASFLMRLRGWVFEDFLSRVFACTLKDLSPPMPLLPRAPASAAARRRVGVCLRRYVLRSSRERWRLCRRGHAMSFVFCRVRMPPCQRYFFARLPLFAALLMPHRRVAAMRRRCCCFRSVYSVFREFHEAQPRWAAPPDTFLPQQMIATYFLRLRHADRYMQPYVLVRLLFIYMHICWWFLILSLISCFLSEQEAVVCCPRSAGAFDFFLPFMRRRRDGRRRRYARQTHDDACQQRRCCLRRARRFSFFADTRDMPRAASFICMRAICAFSPEPSDEQRALHAFDFHMPFAAFRQRGIISQLRPASSLRFKSCRWRYASSYFWD